MCLCFNFSTWTFLTIFSRNRRLNVLAMYLHRYLRLTPLLAVCVFMNVSIVRYLGSGPLWPKKIANAEITCGRFWPSILLYVQNYVNPDQKVSAIRSTMVSEISKYFLNSIVASIETYYRIMWLMVFINIFQCSCNKVVSSTMWILNEELVLAT